MENNEFDSVNISNDADDVSNVPSTFYIVSIIFLIIITFLIGLVLYYYRQAYPSVEKYGANPYCLRVNCTEGEPTYYNVVDDPQQKAWATLNYCVDNSPSSGLIEALNICASNPDSDESIYFHSANATTPTSSNIEIYNEWYNSVYLKNCGYGWIPYANRIPDGDISRIINNCRTNGRQSQLQQFQ